jgi:hypothetical protein
MATTLENNYRIRAVFDNGGETLDRFTIIFGNGEMLGLSETGAGFSQWCGNIVENYMNSSYGYAWRKQCDVEKVFKHELPRIIREFEQDGNIGKRIKASELSKELRKHINIRIKE